MSKRIYKNKKAANFEAYNWFILFFSIAILTIAFLTLFFQYSEERSSPPIGFAAEEVYETLSMKEIILRDLDLKAKIAAHKALRNTSVVFGFEEGDIPEEVEMYHGVPILYKDEKSKPLSYINPEKHFVNLFADYINEELSSYELGYDNFNLVSTDGRKNYFKYSNRSLSVLNGSLIYGFSLVDHVLINRLAEGKDVKVIFSPDFKLELQHYSFDDYKKIDALIREEIYPLFMQESCNLLRLEGTFREHNLGISEISALEGYEVSFNNYCLNIHAARDIHEEYYTRAEIEFDEPENGECRVYLCIRDKSRITSGETIDGKYVVNYPSYKVGISLKYS